MEVEFASRDLESAYLIGREARRRWGPQCARIYVRRVNELRAADNLWTFLSLPLGKPHALRGDRAGQFAVSIHQGQRLIFEPKEPLPPSRASAREILERVTDVTVLEVVDYHGR